MGRGKQQGREYGQTYPLKAAGAAMTLLARADRPRELAAEAFALYEAFRPVVPEGVWGWNAKGVLDLRQNASGSTPRASQWSAATPRPGRSWPSTAWTTRRSG
jgi:hypothetical protein